MKIMDNRVLSKIIITVLLLGLFIAIAVQQKTNIASDSEAGLAVLQQKIIVIDPGHGGADPGAMLDNLNEAELNMVLSLALKNELERHGATVKLTRHGNTGLVPGKKMTNYQRWYNLEKRKAYALRQNCDILVSIHVNSDKDSRTSGAMVFYDENRSGELALLIQENLNSLGLRSRHPVRSSFTVISNLGIPAVLIEAGFITNKKDRTLILQEPVIIAKQICNGILQYEKKNLYVGKEYKKN